MENFGATQQMNVSDRTMVSPAAGGQVTLLGTPIKCAICGTENAPTEKYCGDCGFLLASTPVETSAAVPMGEQARLVASSGQMEYFLKLGENTVGRESADVLLPDPAISRRHARVTLDDDGKCWVEDFGSTNGTYVAGNQVSQSQRIEAADGVEIKFGSVSLILRLPSPVAVEETLSEEIPVDAEVTTAAPESDASVSDEGAAPLTEETAEVEIPPVARLFSASDPAKDFRINEGPNNVGRRSTNDIVITDDQYVSGSHAQIVVDQLGMWLIDVGSTNGTVLNGSKIAPNMRMALSGDDEIVFGQTSLKFHVDE